jgi:uncharacterized protein with PIN domain
MIKTGVPGTKEEVERRLRRAARKAGLLLVKLEYEPKGRVVTLAHRSLRDKLPQLSIFSRPTEEQMVEEIKLYARIEKENAERCPMCMRPWARKRKLKARKEGKK